MLHFGGAELYELFEMLPNTGDENDFEAGIAALDKYFDSQLNPDYERFRLCQAQQFEDESVDTYYGHLRRLTWSCTAIDHDDEVRAQFIQGCKSSTVLRQILRQYGITLDAILVLACAHVIRVPGR